MSFDYARKIVILFNFKNKEISAKKITRIAYLLTHPIHCLDELALPRSGVLNCLNFQIKTSGQRFPLITTFGIFLLFRLSAILHRDYKKLNLVWVSCSLQRIWNVSRTILSSFSKILQSLKKLLQYTDIIFIFPTLKKPFIVFAIADYKWLFLLKFNSWSTHENLYGMKTLKIIIHLLRFEKSAMQLLQSFLMAISC